jgi:small subunit ribosomal protein S20
MNYSRVIGGIEMANIKSAKKRILVIETKTERNKAAKSRVKTFVKKVYAAIDAGDKTAADAALKDAISEISKAASKGIYHKSTASRKISRLTKAVNKIA